ncbi:FeoA family protein [Mycobacterium sp.]|uniref:FeoA family protein n=1 Tax=Mycobacterium sp. TaxID=1785 RepID=UPI001285DDD3|nr:FeoA family protein [Mycobacterium sp.]KAA8969204.1 MAG: ferrous iron transport protein A [Mycobacterium sp.]
MHGRTRQSRRSASPVVLAELTPGQQATVVGVTSNASPAVARRLWQLGFRPDVRVVVLRRAPLSDPTVYRVQDTDLCIRQREALLIEVVPDADR